MTKVYNDIEAVTKLLTEKEKDLELAARIGQSLLDQNKVLIHRNEELENELIESNETVEKLKLEVINTSERVIQLKHDLSMKNGLLQIYSADVEAEELLFESPNNYLADDKTSILTNWEELHKRVGSLEEENVRLRIESTARANDIEIEERKELLLIHDCVKQLTEANVQLLSLQEEIGRKGEDNIRQQEEITNLVSQIVELQRKVKEMTVDNDSLESALQTSYECQNELSQELMEVKERYGTLLAAFHELQTEFKKRSRLNANHYNVLPFSESLASEIESTLGSEGYDSEISGYFTRNKRKTGKEEMRCYSPDSVLSGESSFRYNNNSLLLNNPSQKSYYFPDKLQIVKPIEGSVTLKQWQKLATPHLGVILEKLPGVPNKALKHLNSQLLEFTLSSSFDYFEDKSINKCNINFVTTNSIFTYTTTSLSQTTDSTSVTPSFSNVQLSTGLHSPISTVSSIKQFFGLTKDKCEDITISSEINIKNTLNPVFTFASMPSNGLNFVIPDESLPIPSVISENNLSSVTNATKINPLINNELSNHQNSKISTSYPHIPQNNNNLLLKDNNKPFEDHSKVMNTTNSGIEGLCDMSSLFDNKGSDGIITKCRHSMPPMLFKVKNSEKPKPNTLCLNNSQNINHETMFERADIGVIKTLRKGGYV